MKVVNLAECLSEGDNHHGHLAGGQCGATEAQEAQCESSTHQSVVVGSLSTSQIVCSDNVVMVKYINHHGNMKSHGTHHPAKNQMGLHTTASKSTFCDSTMVHWTCCQDASKSGVCTQKWCTQNWEKFGRAMPNSLIVGAG